MKAQQIISVTVDQIEVENRKKLEQWFVAQDALMEYYEEIEEEGAYPDLYGKSVLLSESQFPKVYAIVSDICSILEISIPECFVYDSYRYLIDSEGISRPRLEISARLLNDFTENELKQVLAKELYHIAAGHLVHEVMAEKILELFDTIPNLPVVNLINQFGGSVAFEAAGFHFRNIAFNWFKSACFSADNFGVAYTGDVRSSLYATLLTIVNERKLAESIHIPAYVGQIGNIEACLGPAATIEIVNEVIPYGPYRIKNMLRFILSADGRKLANRLRN